ncbi:MAG: hypothetical protein ACK4WF_07265, partial [Candidatus Brocadiales bacterium]
MFRIFLTSVLILSLSLLPGSQAGATCGKCGVGAGRERSREAEEAFGILFSTMMALKAAQEADKEGALDKLAEELARAFEKADPTRLVSQEPPEQQPQQPQPQQPPSAAPQQPQQPTPPPSTPPPQEGGPSAPPGPSPTSESDDGGLHFLYAPISESVIEEYLRGREEELFRHTGLLKLQPQQPTPPPSTPPPQEGGPSAPPGPSP